MGQIELEEYATRRGLHPTRAIYAAVWEGMSLHCRGGEGEAARKRIPPVAAEKVAEKHPQLIFLSREA